MPGLLSPIAGHKISQDFVGDNDFEPTLFLATDARGLRRARALAFGHAVQQRHLHGAIDIRCDVGTPILAPQRGRIARRGNYPETGENYMMLEIRPGTVLFFTHLSEFTSKDAKEGDRVAQGAQIALSGNSGRSTGPHLHWEVRVTSKANPNPRKSSRWFKLDPSRLMLASGDLADLPLIQPLGSAPADSPASTAPSGLAGLKHLPEVQPGNEPGPVDDDLELEDDDDEESALEDTIGDVGQDNERKSVVAHRIGGQLEF